MAWFQIGCEAVVERGGAGLQNWDKVPAFSLTLLPGSAASSVSSSGSGGGGGGGSGGAKFESRAPIPKPGCTLLVLYAPSHPQASQALQALTDLVCTTDNN